MQVRPGYQNWRNHVEQVKCTKQLDHENRVGRRQKGPSRNLKAPLAESRGSKDVDSHEQPRFPSMTSGAFFAFVFIFHELKFTRLFRSTDGGLSVKQEGWCPPLV